MANTQEFLKMSSSILFGLLFLFSPQVDIPEGSDRPFIHHDIANEKITNALTNYTAQIEQRWAQIQLSETLHQNWLRIQGSADSFRHNVAKRLESLKSNYPEFFGKISDTISSLSADTDSSKARFELESILSLLEQYAKVLHEKFDGSSSEVHHLDIESEINNAGQALWTQIAHEAKEKYDEIHKIEEPLYVNQETFQPQEQTIDEEIILETPTNDVLEIASTIVESNQTDDIVIELDGELNEDEILEVTESGEIVKGDEIVIEVNVEDLSDLDQNITIQGILGEGEVIVEEIEGEGEVIVEEIEGEGEVIIEEIEGEGEVIIEEVEGESEEEEVEVVYEAEDGEGEVEVVYEDEGAESVYEGEDAESEVVYGEEEVEYEVESEDV